MIKLLKFIRENHLEVTIRSDIEKQIYVIHVLKHVKGSKLAALDIPISYANFDLLTSPENIENDIYEHILNEFKKFEASI